MAKNITRKQEIGALGEDITAMFLKKHDFEVLHRNYLKKWGEIDIVCKKQQKIHFVEVKSVSCENIADVIRETDRFKPEENIHRNKLRRLWKTIQTYLLEKSLENTEWQLDGAVVYIDMERQEAKVEIVDNIIM